MRKAGLVLAATLALAGCGGTSHPTHHKAHHSPSTIVAASCPQAASGHGAMGVCAPKPRLGLTLPRPATSSGPVYPDLSNNDPCVCGTTIRARGQVGLIVKANQGRGFVDGWGVPMVQSARAAGLAVGMYDFDQDYSVSEARTFVLRLQAAGINGDTPNTFPAYFDVEYGNFSYAGLRAQINYVRSKGYRVGIYTGDWYWAPNAGCRWPSGVSAWLSGYPNAPVPCGTTGYNAHQFTSTPIDLTVFLGSLGQFRAFVNAGPPPDPYRILSKTKYPFGRFKFDAYDAVKQYDHPGGPGCSHPLHRPNCKALGWEIHLLHGRRLFVAWHVLTAHGWVQRHHAHWTPQTGAENALLGRRETNRNPTWL